MVPERKQDGNFGKDREIHGEIHGENHGEIHGENHVCSTA